MTRRKRPRRTRRPQQRGVSSSSSLRKISDTLVDFAQPMLELAPPDATAADIEQRLRIVVLLWNAVVIDEADPSQDFLSGIRRTVGQAPFPGVPSLIELLIERKQRDFADDRRLIGHFSVRSDPDGGFTIRAEARAAPARTH
jgi:hypothetical protein